MFLCHDFYLEREAKISFIPNISATDALSYCKKVQIWIGHKEYGRINIKNHINRLNIKIEQFVKIFDAIGHIQHTDQYL